MFSFSSPFIALLFLFKLAFAFSIVL